MSYTAEYFLHQIFPTYVLMRERALSHVKVIYTGHGIMKRSFINAKLRCQC